MRVAAELNGRRCEQASFEWNTRKPGGLEAGGLLTMTCCGRAQ